MRELAAGLCSSTALAADDGGIPADQTSRPGAG
jgi:hypothetical protein